MPAETLVAGEIDLAVALARGSIVPFVGSGFTAAAAEEAGVSSLAPDWSAFVDQLSLRAYQRPLDAPTKQAFQASYPELLQVIIDDVGSRRIVADTVGSLFSEPRLYDAIARRSALYRIFGKGGFPFLLTTNYDLLLERIWPSTPVFDLATRNLPSLLEGYRRRSDPAEQPRAIIKLHGTSAAARVATVSARDYRRLFSDSRAVQELFQWLTSHFSLWFLGYSLRDSDVIAALMQSLGEHPTRQHFLHKRHFDNDLDPRIDHTRLGIRSFSLERGGSVDPLSQRIQSVFSVVNVLRAPAPPSLTLPFKKATSESYQSHLAVLSRYELRESAGLYDTLSRAWWREVARRTGGFHRALTSAEEWADILAFEKAVRHHLFLRSRLHQRKSLCTYILNNLSNLPDEYIHDGLSAVAEGLAYVEPNEGALALVEAELKRRRMTRATLNGLHVRALVARSRARWSTSASERGRLRERAFRLSTLSRQPDLQSALLLDRALSAVLAQLTRRGGGRIADNGMDAASSALELAMFAGSYRRVGMALQRIAILSPSDGLHWAAIALPGAEEVRRLESRYRLYSDCSTAVALFADGQRHHARTLLRRHEHRRLAGSDRAFLSLVVAYTSRRH